MFTFGPSHTLAKIKLDVKISPFEFFKVVSRNFKDVFLLESTSGKNRLAQYSFIGFEPEQKIVLKNKEDAYDEIKNIISSLQVKDNKFRFSGGLVGYVSFEASKLYYSNMDFGLSDFPDMEFGLYHDFVVYDHRNSSVYYCASRQNRLEDLKRVLRQELNHENSKLSVRIISVKPKKEKFEEIVHAVKDYIYSGDVFQVVLSKKYLIELDGKLHGFYSKLRVLNPSPYMYYIGFGERKIVGSSPEMLLRVEGRKVQTYPIAGTTKRTGDYVKDRELAELLLRDEKERAEHVMLVDLARNDIGRVSEYGSVRVNNFMTVQKFSHVQHMVSTVSGILRESCDSIDAFRSVFPAGTVSGAPKERALEIISELEKEPRGPYAGAVGYFSYNGNSDFAITIRTLVCSGNKGYIQSGAGIVADSVPEKEWNETENKATALLKCLGEKE